jgi:hypothetical protein
VTYAIRIPANDSLEADIAGGRLVKQARYYWLLLAESYLTRRQFGTMLERILGVAGADR